LPNEKFPSAAPSSTAHSGNGLAERREHLGDVDSGIVLGKRVEPRDRDAELDAKELDERRVERRVVVEARDGVALADVLARHLDGHQEDRRAVVPVAALLTPPEESEREVERVDAAFLEVGLREAEDLLEPAEHVVGGERRAERAGRARRRVGRLDRDGLVGRESVFERRGGLDGKRQNLLRVAGVQESVAKREVKEFLRPADDAAA